MDNNYIICDGELYHWGVKGMRWGVRRYMNKDGTLTPAGKKRYNKELDKVRKEEQVLKNRAATKAKLDRLNTRKQNVSDKKKQLDEDDNLSTLSKKKTSDNDTPKKRTIHDVPDDELRARVNRLQMEKQYRDLQPKPETVEQGKSFVKQFKDDAIKPAVVSAGKNLLTNYLNKVGSKALGLSGKELDDGISALKKEAERLKYKDQINNYKTKIKSNAEKEKQAAEKAASDKTKAEQEKARKAAAEYDRQRHEKERYDQAQANANARFQADREARQRQASEAGKSRVQLLLNGKIENKPSTEVIDAGRYEVYDILDRDGSYISSK